MNKIALYFLWLFIAPISSLAGEKAFSESAQFTDANISTIPANAVKIRINIILMKNDNGEGGFNTEYEEHIDVIKSAVNWMNASLMANERIKDPNCFVTKTCYPKRTAQQYEYIRNTKIEFKIGKILSYENSKFWDNQDCQDSQDDKLNPNCPDDGLRYRCPNDEYSGNWYLNPLSQQINRDPNILPAINVFYTEDADEFQAYVKDKSCESTKGKFHTQDCSERPSNSLDKEQRVHMRSAFLKYSYLMNCNVCEVEYGDCKFVGTSDECCRRKKVLNNIKDGMSRTLLHELGHSVEFTSGHCNVCPREALMHASQPGKKLHSTEIEYAHKKIKSSNLQRYIVNDEPIYIQEEDQVWNNFLNLHKDYVVDNSKSLILNNETQVLRGNQLQIKKGSLIIKEAGRLTIEKGANVQINKNSGLEVHANGMINLKGGSKLIVACGADYNFNAQAIISDPSLKATIELQCNNIIGPQFLQHGTGVYHLANSIPADKVEWWIEEGNKAQLFKNENELQLVSFRGSSGMITLKAKALPPFEMEELTAQIWVGPNYIPISYSTIITEVILQQISVLYNHLGFVSIPFIPYDIR